MYIFSAKLIYYIPHASSLKDKRQVSRSIIERARKRFNVSIAEVDTQDTHQTLTLGITTVSGEYAFGQNSIDEIIRFMERNSEAELTTIERINY